MKLLIAAVTFVATLGMLFLIEAGKSPKDDYAQIIEALRNENPGTVVSATPAPTKVRTLAPTPASVPQSNPAVGQTSTPAPTQTSARTPSPTPPPVNPSLSPTHSTAPAPSPTPSPVPEPMSEQSEKININTASAEDLDNITGVGPAYAKNIIDYRDANGPFQKIEDIVNVKGIGPKTFEKMKDEITI